jgi:hypothetical protein
MKVGLCGLTGGGRSATFAALTVGAHVASSHAGPLGEIAQSAVKVPDDRLDKLTGIFASKKTTHATIDLIDLPGLGHGQLPKGHNPQIVAEARKQDMLLVVVRDFDDPGNPHALGSVNAARDLNSVLEEFQLADLSMIENRLPRIDETMQKRPQDRDTLMVEKTALEKAKAAIESNTTLELPELPEAERKVIEGYTMLCFKPMAVVRNIGEDAVQTMNELPPLETGLPVVVLCARLEAELSQLDDEEREAFMEDYGVTELSRERVIRAIYDGSSLLTFFTAGEKESRAWPLERGRTALEAADNIHSDIARGFIRAEVYHYDDIVELGSEKAIKAAGKFRLEGKEYVVREGDVIYFRFSV